jgi:CubicO group peptidase (beta-lactamase class C family)
MTRNHRGTLRWFIAIAAFNVSMVLAGSAQASVAPFTPLQQQIETLRKEHDIPGASIAVIENGRIAWARGFGLADLASGRRVTADTLFQAQSITKTLTSLATVKLLAAEEIALDEPVNRYLKGWTIPENDHTKKVPVSFRMLLNHTGGLSNPYPDGCCGPGEPLPTLQQVLRGLPPATNKPLTVERIPGTNFNYCNGCYTVLQPALESISQQSFPSLMQELVFTPAGMDNTSFDNTFFLNDTSTIAIPYDVDGKPHGRAPMRHPILSTGLMWSTASDLARFNLAFTKALNSGHPLIDQPLAVQLSIPSSTANRSLGFELGNRDADAKARGNYLFHSGTGNGAVSLSIISLDGNHGAVFLINKGPNPWLTTNIPQYAFIKSSLKVINTEGNWSD